MNIRSLKNIGNNLCIIFGFDKFFSKLDDDHKKIFKEILTNNKEVLKINFIFIDIPSSFKKYEYEEFYKSSINSSNGIWIGVGVTSQYTIKTNTQVSGMSDISNDYGVIVKNGLPIVVKMINEIK